MHVAPISSSALRDPTKSERRHAGLKQSAWSSVVVTCGVGALVGSDDGLDDGTAVGICDGSGVGMRDGREVGADVGTGEGAGAKTDCSHRNPLT